MPTDQTYFTPENIVQLISCTECGRSWEYYLIAKPEYMITGNYWRERDEIPNINVLRDHILPCPHHYNLDRNFSDINRDTVAAVRPIPYIPTLPHSISIDFALLFIRKEKSLLEMYYDIIEAEPFKSLVQFGEDPGGEVYFIQEPVIYKQRKLQHYSYYEEEVPLYVFSKAHLRILAYLYQKNALAFHEFIDIWIAKEMAFQEKAALESAEDDLAFLNEEE